MYVSSPDRSIKNILRQLIADLAEKQKVYLSVAECLNHKCYKLYQDNCRSLISNLTLLTSLMQSLELAEAAANDDQDSDRIEKMIQQANDAMAQLLTKDGDEIKEE